MAGIFLVIMFLVAPLNPFLALSANSDSSNLEKKISIEQNPGLVEGVEKESQVSVVLPPVPLFQPIRKEMAYNLAIPNAHSSLIMDVDTKKVLYESSGNEQRQIASLTKMMTATLVMEKVSNLDEEVIIDEEAVYSEGTRIGCPRSGYCITQRLKVGEKISVLSLLKAMLMNSAYDAAIALSKHISGSQEEFVKLMNKKAKELGLNDSNFCTASGLEPDGREAECYSSAHDIAYIAAYSMKYDLIWDIMRLPNNTTITSIDGTCSHNILNTDIVMNDITNCIGGKQALLRLPEDRFFLRRQIRPGSTKLSPFSLMIHTAGRISRR